MGRLGFGLADVSAVAQELTAGGCCSVEGFMTHLAVADEDRAFTEHQLDLFDQALLGLQQVGIRPRWVHAAASAGLAFLRPSHTLARPGLLLYGLQPRPLSPPVAVRPVMRLSARVALVKSVPPGASISYGRRWRAERDARIATLPIGYADGVPRTEAMSKTGYLTIGTRRAPVCGTVCMDLTMIDVTAWPDVVAGAEATVFGDEPLAWDVAEWSGTNAWQVLTAVGPRVPRIYHRDGRILSVSHPLS
jgi:alanine racemase